MKYFAIAAGLLSLALPVSLYSQNLHISHCAQGCPTGTAASNEVIVRHLFAVSISQKTGLADWLSYRIIPGSLGVSSLLVREWQDDELVRAGIRRSDLNVDRTPTQTSPSSRQDSVYSVGDVNISTSDRGRLAPMSSFANSSYWSELNLLSVMSLIKYDMRLGPWSRLDQAINDLVRKSGEVFVLVGPIFPELDSVSSEAATTSNLPSAFFKVVASGNGDVTAFLLDQNLAQHKSYCDQITDIETIESRSGLNLFPRANDWPIGSLDRQLGC